MGTFSPILFTVKFYSFFLKQFLLGQCLISSNAIIVNAPTVAVFNPDDNNDQSLFSYSVSSVGQILLELPSYKLYYLAANNLLGTSTPNLSTDYFIGSQVAVLDTLHPSIYPVHCKLTAVVNWANPVYMTSTSSATVDGNFINIEFAMDLARNTQAEQEAA